MRMLLISIVLCCIAVIAEAEEKRFLTTSISRARALAMGSAYHSLVDDFSAALYNPGAFKLNNTREERNFKIFFNPVGRITGFRA